MKLANTIVVGLVVLGTFGLVSVFQTLSSENSSLYEKNDVAVGSCNGKKDIVDDTFCSDIPATVDCTVNPETVRGRVCACGRKRQSSAECTGLPIGPGCTSSPGAVVGGTEGIGEDKVQGKCPQPLATKCKNVGSFPACPYCNDIMFLNECLPDGEPVLHQCKGRDPSLIGRVPGC